MSRGPGPTAPSEGAACGRRVKGQTENALLALPFKAVMFRPGVIVPMHGIVSKTRLYRVFYAVARPILPMRAGFPQFVTTTEQVGRAMLRVAKQGAPKPILETRDINAL